MLTVSRWRHFWASFVAGSFIHLATLLLISLSLAPNLSYMGQQVGPLVSAVVQTQTTVMLIAVAKVFSVCLYLALLLHCACCALPLVLRAFFSVTFFLATLLRLACMYPALAQNLRGASSSEETLLSLASLPEQGHARLFIEWGPFIIFAVVLLLNIIQIVTHILKQNEKLRASRRTLMIEEYERESRRMAMAAVALMFSLTLGGVGLNKVSNAFDFSLPQNHQTAKTNVFIFAIDSLRVDRVLGKRRRNSMPHIQERLKEARLAEPMLVGIPRTFPSWVELSTCEYAIRSGVRTMFPPRAERQVARETLFRSAQTSGYKTLFISDFAGDIFSRFNFGADAVVAPNANLSSLIENSLLQNLPALQAVLVLPRFHRTIDSLLETPAIADPRLLAHTFASTLRQATSGNEPVFVTTFFSQAHFPYAAAAPYFRHFQHPNAEGKFLFKKESDQSEAEAGVTVDGIRREQVRDLYDGALYVTDKSINSLLNELEAKGWLQNSIVVLLGDHGENLYDGNLGMGHGDDVASEHSTTAPLVIWTRGAADEVSESPATHVKLVRSVDLAPTLARRANIPFDTKNCDGMPLLDDSDKVPEFPSEIAYQESGIWFTSGKKSPTGSARVNYPGILGLLDLDTGFHNEFVIRESMSSSVLSAKERAWVTEKYRLVARSTTSGIVFSLYDRDSDPAAEHDLLGPGSNPIVGRTVAAEMIRQLNEYLRSQGTQIVTNQPGSSFYFDPRVK